MQLPAGWKITRKIISPYRVTIQLQAIRKIASRPECLTRSRSIHSQRCRRNPTPAMLRSDALVNLSRSTLVLPLSSITLKCSTTGASVTVTSAASVRRPLNRLRCEDRICLRAWGQSIHLPTRCSNSPFSIMVTKNSRPFSMIIRFFINVILDFDMLYIRKNFANIKNEII